MKHIHVLLAILFISISLQAQTEKGFKYLTKGKYDLAYTAFAKDTTLALMEPAAWYGMALVLLEEKNKRKDVEQALALQARSLKTWDVLTYAQQAALSRDYKITKDTIEALSSRAEAMVWKSVEKTKSLPEIDRYLQRFSKPSDRTPKRLAALKVQLTLIESAVNTSDDYETMRYAYNNHYPHIKNMMKDQLEPMRERMFLAFLKERGVDRLDEFSAENPKIILPKDAAMDAFKTAWKSTTLPPLIDFLGKYSGSGFAPMVQQKGVDWIKAHPNEKISRQALSENEVLILAEMEWLAVGNTYDDLKMPFDESLKSIWLNYIRQIAPSEKAGSYVEAMYKFYAGKRDWNATAEILREGAALFPLHRREMAERLKIVEQPDAGSLPVSVGPVINTPADEYTPVLTADGKRLYFGGKKRSDNINGEDVYMSERIANGWTAPVLIRELSGQGNQVPVSITGDGNKILIFNNGRPFQSERTATGWTPMQPMAGISGLEWVGLVQVAANNQLILLEARNGDANGIDIFVVLRDLAGNWTAPVRLSPVINTPGDDRTPFLHPDLKTLYFSSNGHGGLGELDVFVTKRLDESWINWSTPVNLGKNINTIGNDWGYNVSTDGSTAWFGTMTEDHGEDIFFVNVPVDENRADTVKLVSIIVRDAAGRPITEGNIVVKDPVTGAILGTFRLNPDGGPTTLTILDDRQYLLTLEKEGYYPQSMSMPKSQPGQSTALEFKWEAAPLAVGVTRELNIFFDFAKDELRPESTAELQQIADLNKKHGYRIKLTGHTDNVGSPAANLDLSRRRAAAARQALINLGVPPAQVEAHGRGETQPVQSNDTEEHRAQNRRVEVELLGK